MAGEIAQDVAITIALSSAAIGASGAIASQVVAGLITGRREQRKAKAETERWKFEAEAKRRDRQFDHKIEVFSKFLSTAKDMELVARSPDRSPRDPKERLREGHDQLKDLTEEIGILAPELYEIALLTWHAGWSLDLMFFSHAVIGRVRTLNEEDKYDRGESLREARISLSAWSDIFRLEARSYMNHEPIRSKQEVEAIHAAFMKEELEFQRSLQNPTRD